MPSDPVENRAINKKNAQNAIIQPQKEALLPKLFYRVPKSQCNLSLKTRRASSECDPIFI